MNTYLMQVGYNWIIKTNNATQIGRSRRTEVASVIVEEKPRVVLSVDPPPSPSSSAAAVRKSPKGVSELLNANVTLVCLPADLSSGEEERFRAVRWYLDGELLRAVTLSSR